MAVLLPLLAVGQPVYAQDQDPQPVEPATTDEANSATPTPVAIEHELSRDVGELTAYPLLNVGIGYRTDIYDSDGDSTDSPVVGLRIGGGVQGEDRGHLYGAEYMAESAWYLDSDAKEDDEVTQRLVVYWGTAFDARNNIDLGVHYLDSYDPRGQDDPLNDIRDTTLAQNPDTWNEFAYGANYNYGANGARGRLEFGACLTCRDYDNNNQDYRDRDVTDLGATLYVRMTGRTDGFAQVVYSDFDYTNGSPVDPAGGRSLDSEEWRYMLGATWKASEKTTGIARVGMVDKDFSHPFGNKSDYSEMTWDAVVHWLPGSRDRLSLAYFRAPREPLVWELDQLVDNFVQVEQVSLDWTHQMRDNLLLNLNGYKGWDNWKPSGRDDDLWGAAAGLRYSLPRWGSIGISYFYRERSSSANFQDYSDGGVFLDFNIGSMFGFGDSRAPAICLLRSYNSAGGFNGLSGY